MSNEGRPGERYNLRLDEDLMSQVREAAKIRGQTIRAFIEEAVTVHVVADQAARNDQQMAPLIAKLIHDSQKQHAGSLRTLIVRIGLEVGRLTYMFSHFANVAGVDWGKLSAWREEGYRAAVRELKQEPAKDETGA